MIKITRTHGYWIETTFDKYIDITSGGFAFPFGYANDDIIATISNALSKISRCNSSQGYTTNELEKAIFSLKRLANCKEIVWAVSGTGAVEASIYYARNAIDKPGIISYVYGWHGTSYLTRQLSGFNPILDPHVHLVKTPIWIKEEQRVSEEARVLEQTLSKIKTNQIGIIVINPAPWFNGVNPWSTAFWNELRTICNDYDILIIADEIASCWGRHKNFFGYKTLMPFEPDIIAIGKAITGGYAPLSAALITKKVYDRLNKNLFYGHTYRPYVGGIAALNKTIEIINTNNIISKVSEIEYNLQEIGDFLVSSNIIDTFRVNGATAAYDLRKNTPYSDALKTRYYGSSNNLQSINTIRVHPPFIADANYFTTLTSMLEQL